MTEKYRSYSGFQRFNACHRQEKYARNRKQYLPSHESAAGTIGKAIHAAIKTLHEFPDYSLEAEVASAVDYEESITDVQIDWGMKGRDKRIAEAIEIVRWYFHWNKDIDLRSSERWFYVPLPELRHQQQDIAPIQIGVDTGCVTIASGNTIVGFRLSRQRSEPIPTRPAEAGFDM